MSDFQSQYAEVNDIRLHYISVGAGKLIMFVHGFPEFWLEWEKQLADSEKDQEQIGSILNLPQEMLTVQVPTLVVWGEQDRALLTGNLDGLEEYIEDLTVKRIPDGTHWVIHEQPDLVNSLIRDFIK